MTSLDVRSNSAVMKRAEQLKRWEESDTNRAPAIPRPEHGRKIKFSSGCVFLAACLSSDKEEVLKLLENGADINTANVDGLTALHQACIDDNLDMVEFLVEQGADINRQDNEGWTPLHATASCGFVSIARFLVEHGADVAAVNSDGDLALDLAIDIQHMPMIEYMQQVVNEHKIDCDRARQAEEQMMLADAKKWLRSDASEVDRPHGKTGATALHVAAAKGYTKVISLLLAGRANVDKQDNDGWTPLHAAGHWGQKEAAEMLVDAMADMEIRNYAGQTCIDVADRKMIKFLEELRTKSKRTTKRRPSSQIRISDEQHIENLTPKILRTDFKNDFNSAQNLGDDKNVTTTATIKTITKKSNTNEQANEQQTTTTTNVMNNSNAIPPTTTTTITTTSPDIIEATLTIPKSAMNISPAVATTTPSSTTTTTENEDAPWRRNNLTQRVRLQLPDRPTELSENSDVILRRTQSFENDKKKPFMPQRTALSLALSSNLVGASTSVAANTTTTTATIAISTTAATTITTNTNATQTATNTTPKRRSFAPPARNEESETQRKAHAKRVRESRRSTQGVTLDEIKSAEELVKKTNSTMSTNNNNNNMSTATTTTSIGTSTTSNNNNNISNIKLNSTTATTTTNKLEEPLSVEASFTPTNNSKIILSAPAVIVAAQRNSVERPKNSALDTTAAITAEQSPYVSRRFSNNNNNNNNNNNILHAAVSVAEQDKDNDKENDNRTTLTTQAVLQRRRKPKRRSTGVVHIDMDDLEPERQDAGNDAEDKDDELKSDELIDYKTLWEAEKLELEQLKQQLDKRDEDILQLKATIERHTNAASAKNSLSELEKRERRAMERKLSEMEEELKQLELYKTENQRLKEENGALIRVISKLSK